MIHVSLNASIITFKADKYKQKYLDTLRVEFKKACQQQLIETAKNVHSYSGMALGSLLPIAAQLGIESKVRSYINIHENSKLLWRRRPLGDGSWSDPFPIPADKIDYSRTDTPLPTVEEGEKLGQDSVFDYEKMRYELHLGVKHYEINEFSNVTESYPEYWFKLKSPLPWFSLRSGKAAFYEYRNTIYRKLPTLKNFTTKNLIEVQR